MALATNLRPALTSFVGRAAAQSQLEDVFFGTPGERLVTLVGPGGAGKTRLAQEFGLTLVDHGTSEVEAVWFCDLSDTAELDEVWPVMAASVDGGVPLGDDPLATLETAFGRRATLLIVDNLEQLPGIGPYLMRLLQAVDTLRILATSRSPLGCAGECTIRVGALDSDDAALRLLVERARERRAGYEPSEAERARLSEVVLGLDRLPLAIELAAPLLGVMDADALHERLSRRFELLARPGGGEARHDSLHGVLESMWEPLSPELRTALVRLAPCAGGFDYAFAEALIGEVSVSGGAAGVVNRLVDRSLLRRWTTEDGRLRMALYATVRAFAAERTDEDERHAARERHRAHLASAATARAARVVRFTDVPEDQRWLARERENLVAAIRLDHATDADSVCAGLRCAAALLVETRTHHTMRDLGRLVRPALDALGHLVDGTTARRVLDPGDGDVEVGLAAAEEVSPACIRALCDVIVPVALGLAAAGRSAVAEGLLERARRLAASVDDEERAGWASFELALLLRTVRGRIDDSFAACEAAIEQLDRRDAPALHAMAVATEGLIHLTVGAFEDAGRCLELAVRMAIEVGAERLLATLRRHVSIVGLANGDLLTTRDHLAFALATEQRFDDILGQATTLNAIAVVTMRLGELDSAATYARSALELHTQLGQRMPMLVSWSTLARVALEQGEIERARRHIRSGRELMPEHAAPRIHDRLIECDALISLVDNDFERAHRVIETLGAGTVGNAAPESQIERALMRLEIARLRKDEEGLDTALHLVRELPKMPDHVEYRGLHALAKAFATWVASSADPAVDPAVLDTIVALLEPGGRHAVLDHSIRTRFWLERLFRALGSEERERVFVDALGWDTATAPRRLVVSLDGLRLWDWHGERVETIDFGRRHLLGRVFGRLVDAAVAGEGLVTPELLLEAGWGGEKMLPDAAANRLHKCLSDLRKQGLRTLIETHEDGYCIDPSVAVERLPADFRSWWRSRRDARVAHFRRLSAPRGVPAVSTRH